MPACRISRKLEKRSEVRHMTLKREVLWSTTPLSLNCDHRPRSPFPLSNFSTSRRNISALNARNACSTRALVSGSLVIVLLADDEPLSKPNSPPKNIPPAENKVYAAMSPSGVGFKRGVMSGMASESSSLSACWISEHEDSCSYPHVHPRI